MFGKHPETRGKEGLDIHSRLHVAPQVWAVLKVIRLYLKIPHLSSINGFVYDQSRYINTVTVGEHRTERLQKEREPSLCFAVLPLLRQLLFVAPNSHQTNTQVRLSAGTAQRHSLHLVLMCFMKGHFKSSYSF